MSNQNRRWLLAKRPEGMPNRSDFQWVSEPIPQPGAGELLVRVLYVSLDPAMRGWMKDARSYIKPIALGEVIRAGAVGRVVASNHPNFSEGSYVYGGFGLQDYALSNGEGVTPIDPRLAPLPTYLGALGMPGMTAYFGFFEVGQPKPGETVVVSGAAGAVGSLVGQMAKIHGCRAVGIAGGPEKNAYVVNELGFDACIDYKNEKVSDGLKTHCPKGIDIYFDNVGGDILDAALARLNFKARIPICGAISQYNATDAAKGPVNYLALLVQRARMEGFIVFDYADRYGEAFGAIGGWLKQGKLVAREHVVPGLETFPETFLMLFDGSNHGKLVIEVAEP